jgi:thioesterase domain-containing protein
MIITKIPQSSQDFTRYYHLRWQILRKPWQQRQGSEKDALEEHSCHRMLTDQNDNILAVARFHKTDQHNAQIRYMAVTHNQQGRGLGKYLLTTVEQAAAQQGVNVITLNARKSAIAFYQKQGYITQNFSHQLYGEVDHYVMTKSLTTVLNHQESIALQLQNLWHNTIPLSKAMNIELNYYDGKLLLTSCDPTMSKNLHNTMFAGSIYTLATLTGWGWVYMQLAQANAQHLGDTVLATGNIRYLSPLVAPAYARTCSDLVTGCCKVLREGKKARFTIKVEIMNGDKVAAVFEGSYVVIPK